MSAGEIAGLIAALAFVALVGFTAVPLLKLGRVLDETRIQVKGVGDETMPLLREVTTTVTTTNATMVQVDAISTNVANTTSNVSALTAIFASVIGGPAIKVASFSYGVRWALTNRRRSDIERQVRAEIRAERESGRAGRSRRKARG